MINFFRKIRYNLMEQNKTGKYLKYAVGEIVLVMLGILLALQVNNWNEERKENIIRDSYLVRLLIDQEKDNINLEQLLKDRKAYIEKVEKYTEYFNKGDYSLSQLKDSAMSIPMDLHRYIPADITYKELINTGNIRLINEDLRVLLAELSREKELSGIINNITINDIFAQNRELKKYWDFTQNFHETLNIEQDKSNIIHGLMLRNNVFRTNTDWASSMIWRYNDHIIRNNEVIELIEKELNN
jgi:Family of unknown function (DUF6090)